RPVMSLPVRPKFSAIFLAVPRKRLAPPDGKLTGIACKPMMKPAFFMGAIAGAKCRSFQRSGGIYLIPYKFQQPCQPWMNYLAALNTPLKPLLIITLAF